MHITTPRRAASTGRSLVIALLLYGLTSAALTLLTSCGNDLQVIKSNALSLDPRLVSFVPGTSGTRETSRLFEVRNTGEAPLIIYNVYLDALVEGTQTRIEGCDFETEMIPDTTILVPEVLPTCSLIVRNRPEPGSEVAPGQFRQIELVYRPIDGLDDPVGARLIVETNSNEEPTAVAEIEISRGFPDISQNVEVVQFPGGAPGRQSYLLRNLGSAPLEISNITVELSDPETFPAPPSGEVEFSFDADRELRDLQIQPNEFLRLQIAYNPEDEGVDQANLVISSNDPDEPTFRVLLTSEARAATLLVTPSPVVFTHARGATDTQVVTFSNTGLSPINAFLSVESPEGAYRIAPSEMDSFQVSPGAEHTVRVEYEGGESPAEGTLVVSSNDAENFVDGELRVPLSTTESSSLKLLEVDETSLSFDGVAAGESVEQTITLSSTGDAPVEISAIELEGGELDVSVFSVADTSGGALAPSETRQVTVTFTRPADEVAANAYQADLVVRNDGLGGDVLVTLVANP